MANAAFDAGYDACYDGVRATQNPHTVSQAAYWDWQRGWDTANGEMLTERDCAEVDDEEYAATYY